MAQYGKSEYWEDRYQKDKEQFDWYQRYSQLSDIITQYVNKSDNILNVGCGNSRKLNSKIPASNHWLAKYLELHEAFTVKLWS